MALILPCVKAEVKKKIINTNLFFVLKIFASHTVKNEKENHMIIIIIFITLILESQSHLKISNMTLFRLHFFNEMFELVNVIC